MPHREKELNRSLRRADWRFLLENPHPAKSVCFCGGLLARAVQAISRAISNPEPGSCDLAVVTNPRQRTLVASYRALKEHGALYTEWYSPFSGGPTGVKRRLEAAGFDNVLTYSPWPWPWLRSPKVWIPLGCDAARAYVENGPAQGWRAAMRIGYRTLKIIDRVASRLGLSVPVCAVARKPVLADTPRNSGSSLLLLTGGPRSISKAVGLVFEAGRPDPKLVLKMSRTPEAASGLWREADTLQALHGIPGLPVVSFATGISPVRIVGESAMAGRQIGELLCRKNYEELAVKGMRWLTQLAGRREAKSEYAALEEFEAVFGHACEPGELRSAKRVIASLDGVPAACEHRDFSPWNVLIDAAGEIAVLDWESSEINGLAGPDLIYFLTYMAFFHDGAIRTGKYLQSYRRMMDPGTFTGAVFRNCTLAYARAIGLNEEALPGLRLCTWMIHGIPEHRRALEDGVPSPAHLRSGLFFQLWREELARAKRPAVAMAQLPC